MLARVYKHFLIVGRFCVSSGAATTFHWGLMAMLIVGGGSLFGVSIVIKTVFLGEAVQGYPSMMAIMTLLGGIQLLTIGLLGEYVGKIYLETKQRPLYLIRDVIENRHATIQSADDKEHKLYAAK